MRDRVGIYVILECVGYEVIVEDLFEVVVKERNLFQDCDNVFFIWFVFFFLGKICFMNYLFIDIIVFVQIDFY